MSAPSPTPPPSSNSAASAKLTRDDFKPEPRTGWRRLIPADIQRKRSGLKVKILWGQALATFVVLVALGWTLMATGGYFFVKYRRGFTDVRFTHMFLYPWKKEEFRVARGDFIIEEAKAMLKEGRLREAYYGMRVGASLSPANRDGRMLLAQLHVFWQRPDLAHKLLVEGVDANQHDTEYLQALFSFLLQRQADQDVIEISDRLLGTRGADAMAQAGAEDRVRLIAMARATAQFFRGNYDAAEDTLKKYRLLDMPDGQILGLRVEWERGEREIALARLQMLTEQLPENEQIYAQYAAYLREAGRDDELRRLCLLRQLSFPDRPRARIDLLYIYDKAKDVASVEAGVEELFRDFPQNGEVMLALADFAANTGRPALARRIYEYCKANELPWEGPALMTVEAHVVAKEYNEALEACRQMIKENPEWGKRFYSVFNGLQAIANYGLKDIEAAQLFLNNFLDQAGVRADNLVAVSSRLMAVGAKEQARQVLAQAVRSDPLNQTALIGLIKLDLDLGQADLVAEPLRALLGMRKPPRDLLQNAYAKLASDQYLFTAGRAALLNEIRTTIGGGS